MRSAVHLTSTHPLLLPARNSFVRARARQTQSKNQQAQCNVHTRVDVYKQWGTLVPDSSIWPLHASAKTLANSFLMNEFISFIFLSCLCS